MWIPRNAFIHILSLKVIKHLSAKDVTMHIIGVLPEIITARGQHHSVSMEFFAFSNKCNIK